MVLSGKYEEVGFVSVEERRRKSEEGKSKGKRGLAR